MSHQERNGRLVHEIVGHAAKQPLFSQLQAEITRVLGGTTFNSKHILGSDATTLAFQVGANTTADDTIFIGDVESTELGVPGPGLVYRGGAFLPA